MFISYDALLPFDVDLGQCIGEVEPKFLLSFLSTLKEWQNN